jgi:hypothetical protein
MAYAANHGATAYLSSEPASVNPATLLNVTSCVPSQGSTGTNVTVRFTSSYDLQAMTTPGQPVCWILFGGHRQPAQLFRENNANGGYVYNAVAAAPQSLATQYGSPADISLSLVVEDPNGTELGRANEIGGFSYQDVASGVPVGSADIGASSGLDTRRTSLSHGHRDSPPSLGHDLNARNDNGNASNAGDQVLQPDATNTNTYGYAGGPDAVSAVTAQAQVQDQSQGNFVEANTDYNQAVGDGMLGSYRTSSYADQYSRAPPSLRPTYHNTWSHAPRLGSARSSLASIAHHAHTITRPSLSQISHSNGMPQLVRTSTLSSGTSSVPPASAYSSYAVYPSKAQLKINGDLDSMANNWTEEEWENRRRIVLFKKNQHGSQLTTTFRPVSVNDRPPNSICISCIWWAEKNECFVTSVDTISLLEQLVAAPARFTVEEKNRIRRNLEGFHPLTVSKGKSDSEEFFKVIMSFGNPKPRNIEKDVKVFPWKILGQALKKIISKYSASPSSTISPSTPTHLLTPVSVSGAYSVLPPTPGTVTTSTDTATATGYLSAPHHHQHSILGPTDTPRSFSAATGVLGSTWPAGYPPASGPSRTLSPVTLRSSSPAASLRISTLHSTYDTRGPIQAVASPHSLQPITQYSPHASTHASASYTTSIPVSQSRDTRSWEAFSLPSTYSATQSHSQLHSQNHGHSTLYGSTTGYGDGVPRA